MFSMYLPKDENNRREWIESEDPVFMTIPSEDESNAQTEYQDPCMEEFCEDMEIGAAD